MRRPVYLLFCLVLVSLTTTWPLWAQSLQLFTAIDALEPWTASGGAQDEALVSSPARDRTPTILRPRAGARHFYVDPFADDSSRQLAVVPAHLYSIGQRDPARRDPRHGSPISATARLPRICQLGALRIYRGNEIAQSSAWTAGSLALRRPLTDGFSVALDKSVLIEASGGTVTVDWLDANAPTAISSPASTQIGPLSYLIRSDIHGRENSLLAEFAIHPTSQTPSGLKFTDLVSGSVVSLDFESQSVSCPSTGTCFTNCVLNSLCDSLSPCQLGLLIGEVALCIGGVVPVCLDVAVELGKAAACLGVDCYAKCAGGGNPPPTPGNCAHSPCTSGGALQPSCSSCVATVCNADSYCCNNNWDSQCVKEAQQWCGSTCNGGGNPPPSPGNCDHSPCTTGIALKPSCSSCVATVCNADSYCCNNNWDSLCVQEAKQWCGGACP